MPYTGAFWAKSWRDENEELRTHGLFCHLIDVGIVAEELIRLSPRRIGAWVSSLFPELTDKDSCRLAATMIALHDIGKLSPGFQAKVEELMGSLEALGFEFSPGAESNHGVVSYVVLKRFLSGILRIDTDSCAYLSDAIAGHHGAFLRSVTPGWVGDGKWDEERGEMIALVLRAFRTSELRDLRVGELTASSVCLFAGLTSIADWIGSDDEYFTFCPTIPDSIDDYLEERRAIAIDRIHAYGLYESEDSPATAEFSELFPNKVPRSLQQRTIDMVTNTEPPFLAIVETPTGSGKTEATLAAYAKLVSADDGPAGLYYALPTRTTGNQIFGRVKDFLGRLYRTRPTELQLLHGEAAYEPQFVNLRLGRVYDDQGNGDAGGVRASNWFAGRKKGLLAEHGVGTIDQAMLAGMQVKHFFVRLWGLADKLLVLDELHAYDDYMEQIIDRLVEWMKAIGTSVVILSATLPNAKKRALFEAFGASTGEDNPTEVTYPSITVVDRCGRIQSESVQSPSERSLRIILNEEDSRLKGSAIADRAVNAARNGGCIGVIVNTVDTAQAVYLELVDWSVNEKISVLLLHARLSRERRRIVETEISAMLGPDAGARRPDSAIVVATQVIEQSVDFDFDFLVTEIAPVDLLLQRAGRLHRRSDTVRPAHLQEPVLEVSVPDSENRFDFGSSAFVYDQLILARTRLLLETLPETDRALRVPTDVRWIIESVYGEDPVSTIENETDVDLDKALRESESKALAERFSARVAALPSIRRIDDPEVLDDLRSLSDSDERPSTRLNAESINLIVMREDESTSGSLDQRSIGQLLERSVPVSLAKWVRHFRDQPVPEMWQSNATLRYARPLPLSGGEYRCEVGVLRYDDVLGLREVSQEEK